MCWQRPWRFHNAHKHGNTVDIANDFKSASHDSGQIAVMLGHKQQSVSHAAKVAAAHAMSGNARLRMLVCFQVILLFTYTKQQSP